MASKNKTKVPLDPQYDWEDPPMSWIDLVMATREPNHDIRMAKINELCIVAKNSHWTHDLWDQVMAELETSPEFEVLDEDSADDDAADALANLRPEHHSFREESQWDQ